MTSGNNHFRLDDENFDRIAAAIQAQNPEVYGDIYDAKKDLVHFLSRVIKEGRQSEDGYWYSATAGFCFEYRRDEEGGEDVTISFQAFTLWPTLDGSEVFEWSVVKELL